MSAHPDKHLLEAFAFGDLGDATAALIAEHLDACPLCSRTVAALDPTTAMFVGAADVDVPMHLVAKVLAEADAGRAPAMVQPWAELAIGATLLSLAAATTVSLGGFAAWWGRAVVLLDTMSTVASHALTSPLAAPSLLVTALLFLLGSIALVATRSRSHRSRS